jgi:hypothetical protein
MKTTPEIEVIWYSTQPLVVHPEIDFKFSCALNKNDLIVSIGDKALEQQKGILVVLDARKELSIVFKDYDYLVQHTPKVKCCMVYGRTFDTNEIWHFIQKSVESLRKTLKPTAIPIPPSSDYDPKHN